MDEGDGLLRALEDELGIEPEDAVAEAGKLSIPACIGAAPERVVAAVHFDDEPRGWGDEVDDEATDDPLTAEPDAGAAALE